MTGEAFEDADQQEVDEHDGGVDVVEHEQQRADFGDLVEQPRDTVEELKASLLGIGRRGFGSRQGEQAPDVLVAERRPHVGEARPLRAAGETQDDGYARVLAAIARFVAANS
jgi:hypothetical protein